MQVCTTVSGKTALMASGKPFSPQVDRDQDILDAAGLELVHDSQPELGPVVGDSSPPDCCLIPPTLLDPQAQDLARPIGKDAERDVDRLVPHEALVADLHPDRVEKHQRVAGVERAPLPLGHLLEHGIGDR